MTFSLHVCVCVCVCVCVPLSLSFLISPRDFHCQSFSCVLAIALHCVCVRVSFCHTAVPPTMMHCAMYNHLYTEIHEWNDSCDGCVCIVVSAHAFSTTIPRAWLVLLRYAALAIVSKCRVSGVKGQPHQSPELDSSDSREPFRLSEL